jgi:uncharacterized protein (DUF1778 family)
MGAAAQRAKADKLIPMRVQESLRDLIDQAAAISGKARTEFILESAKARAIDVLLDQRLLALDEEQMAAVDAALANPPQPTAALRKLMKSKAPWE